VAGDQRDHNAQGGQSEANAVLLPLCYTLPSHFKGLGPGKWSQGEKISSATDLRHLGRKCRFRQDWEDCRGFLFSDSTDETFRKRAQSIGSRQWSPRICRLQPFDASKLSKRFRGRTILFAGDSLSKQLFTAFICRLEPLVTKDSLEWHPQMHSGVAKRCAQGSSHCWFRKGCVELANGFRVCHSEQLEPPRFKRGGHDPSYDFSTAQMLDNVQEYNMSTTDVYVFGQMSAHGMVNPLDAYAVTQHLQDHRHELPFFIWREPSPQHFDSRGGKFSPGASASECQRQSLQESEFFGMCVCIKNIMAAAGIPVLDTLSMSIAQWDAHIGFVPSSSKMDCTHWCTPGVVDVWSVVLFNQLMNIDLASAHRSNATSDSTGDSSQPLEHSGNVQGTFRVHSGKIQGFKWTKNGCAEAQAQPPQTSRKRRRTKKPKSTPGRRKRQG
jgi:hypothetical protein